MDQTLRDSWITWLGNNTYNGEFSVGQEFDSLHQLKDIVKSYSITKNQSFRVVESEPSKYVVECKRKKTHNCPWKLRAIKDPMLPIFRVVKYNGPHANNCVGDIISGDHQNLTSEFVCNIILDLVRVDPSLKIRAIVQVIKDRTEFSITYRKAWLAKQKAIAIIFGDWEKSYEELPRYMQALQEANEGTVVHWSTIETSNPFIHVFKRVFWAFKPFIDGFRHCRPLITIDGTHLYGRYKGTLLIAMATDANFYLFPLAFAIVENESIKTWSWFMACLRQSVTQRRGLCVISDRHAGILDALNKEGSGWEEPFAHHRFCIRHLASNVGKHFKTHMKNLFGRAADERQKKKFDFWFKRIGDLNIKAREYLENIPFHLWSIHHDGGFRYGIRTTNMSECFNEVMKGARCLPIKAIVEMTFFRVNSYFVTRRGWGKRRLDEGHEYSEKAYKIIERNMQKSAAHSVKSFDYEMGLFQVTIGRGNRPPGKGDNKHNVDLVKKTCTCGKFLIYKLPCSHILAVCRDRNLSYASFIDPFFSTHEYRQTYIKSFKPLPDVPYWPPYVGPKVIANVNQKRGKPG
ncbi:uncharacterized protein LOC110691915 [Chenopodium quinoa]|uniref:uncharacterized protein LOC110691915 n=1 Tax=Chenopodium quinoa TaxID=63459 RepID=UPI000B76F514|nr:uncharacterized protein LOC110691915 [Chenopodium quinoa]